MFQNQAETIFVELNNRMFNEMITEAAKWPGKETGGMMFGKIEDLDSSLKIRVVKTHIPPVEMCTRDNSYFEINPEHAKSILQNENLLYLGNWHKHLGYGGPSYGDHREIAEFFTLNPHKKIVMSLIVDFLSIDNYKVIIEVYRRYEDPEEEIDDFQTLRIAESNISYYSDNNLSEEEVGITKEQLSVIKQELIDVYDPEFTLEDIQYFKGSNEKILSFPYKTIVETDQAHHTLDLLVLISFPPEFPDDQIYIDVSSQDMLKRFTIEKHPANVLYEEELIQPFLKLLKATLEERIPQLMKEPFWKVMTK